MQRREFLEFLWGLPAFASLHAQLPKLVLRLDHRANVRITNDRLAISFDLWRSIVDGIGGEASLGLRRNFLPEETACRASVWLLKQAAIEAPFDRDIPVMLQMQDFGIVIPLKRMAEFFSQGTMQIVLFSVPE